MARFDRRRWALSADGMGAIVAVPDGDNVWNVEYWWEPDTDLAAVALGWIVRVGGWWWVARAGARGGGWVGEERGFAAAVRLLDEDRRRMHVRFEMGPVG
jgi:hypothetical protein